MSTSSKYGEPWYTTGFSPGSNYTSLISEPTKIPVDEHRRGIAERIVACVNAMEGIDDPAQLRRERDAAREALIKIRDAHPLSYLYSIDVIKEIARTALGAKP